MRIVVDANVARSAGHGRPGAGHPGPEAVAALEAVRHGDHRVVMGQPRLKGEWRTHAGAFATRWLATMIATKRFDAVTEADWPDADELLTLAADLPGDGAKDVAKDAHLVASAMLTDRRVVSFDVSQRELLRRLPAERFLMGLHWVSPVDAGALDWLQRGALPERDRLVVLAD